MAPHPMKRRKLEHGSDQESLRSDNVSVDGLEDNDTDTDEQPAKSQKKAASRPTSEQTADSAAMYAGDLYKSSMFKLQVDEMLSEIRPNYEKRMGPVNEALRKLKTIIDSIADREPLSVVDATKAIHKSHKIVIPYPEPKPKKDAAYKLAYMKPTSVNVTGSYALKTMTKTDSNMAVDMIITMPASILQEKDYLNYRYFYKRAYYLACIAAGLQDAGDKAFVMDFEYLNGNTLQPILVLRASNGSSDFANSKCNIRIIPTAPEKFFPISKLLPTKNAIRPKDTPTSQDIALLPTQFYNSTVLADASYAQYLKVLHSATTQSDGFRDACVLGRVWLQQRGFGADASKGGFGHFEWAAMTALLLQGCGPKGHSVLSPGYSSYQLFKAVIQYLATNDLISKPMLYQASELFFTKGDRPMFYDGLRGVNILYRMSPWAYKSLVDEARTSLEMLNDAVFDQFEAAFILRTDQPLQKFDTLVTVPCVQDASTGSGDHSNSVTRVTNKTYWALKEGLTDRIKTIDIQINGFSSWSLKAAAPGCPNASSFLIGIVFDPANIDRAVDHGPPAEEKKKAAAFQRFWGEKAELRRFKDGSILESVVWAKGVSMPIYQQIVTFLLARHVSMAAAGGAVFRGQDIDGLVPQGAFDAFNALREDYKILEKDVRDLESLPLQLRQLSPISPLLRSTSILPPVYNAYQPLKTPAEVLIQFEGSGRWPDDIIAIQMTKMAFLLKIGDLLEEAVEGLVARIGLENADHPLLNCAFLDIKYPSGAIFRLRIHSDREQVLLERQVKDKSVDNRAREDAAAALAIYRRVYLQLPLHTQSVTTHSTRFPLLSPTIRLVKRWFDIHMLSGHVCEELIELLTVRTFLQPYPWRAPSSAMSGFLRTLLFISRWDWRLTPLVVDFSGTMTGDDVAAITTRLEAWRKIDPSMSRTVLIAASNHDATGTAFTECGPSKVVAARMTALARSACKVIKEQGTELDVESLFSASTAEYDFVIRISPKFQGNAKAKKSSKTQFKNLEVQEEEGLWDIGYEPVQLFIEDIKTAYNSSIVLFYNPTDKVVIAGLWNPQTAARPFKVNLQYATKPCRGNEGSGKSQVEIDKSAILAEIGRLGGDMIAQIDSK